MLRQGYLIGVFASTDRSSPFTDKQIELLKTFADQAVIAIENARLFEEVRRGRAISPQSVGTPDATARSAKRSAPRSNSRPVLETSSARRCVCAKRRRRNLRGRQGAANSIGSYRIERNTIARRSEQP